VTVHFEVNGELISMLLDIVEVPRSHSGINLAMAFTKILEDFGIANKVRYFLIIDKNRDPDAYRKPRFSA
jgi:hypothetical protein